MLLAIDTSGPFCSAALWSLEHNKCVAEVSENLGRGHAERLMPMLEELLEKQDAKWSAISKLAVVIGPGSFTGLRVGIATARGLALALDAPCVGVTVFEAFAQNYFTSGQNRKPVLIAMDAKRNQYWIQSFDAQGYPQTNPIQVEAEKIAENIDKATSGIIGSGAKLIAEACEGSINVINDSPSPPIVAVAAIGAKAENDSTSPRPLYLRAPDAKPQNAQTKDT